MHHLLDAIGESIAGPNRKIVSISGTRLHLDHHRVGWKVCKMATELAIDVEDLTFSFAEGLDTALTSVDLQLEKGSRCLLVGANGGKRVHLPHALDFGLSPVPS